MVTNLHQQHSSTRDPATSAAWVDVSDRSLVERVRGGEASLFEVLMRRYNQRLYRVSRAILGDASEAEDVMQDAYIQAFTHLDDLRGADRFAGWLTRIAVHEARARVRRRQRHRRLASVADNLVVLAPGRQARAQDDPERVARAHELREALTSAVDSLSTSQREVWILREVEGLASAEVAECLSISVASVRVRLHRARHALRAELLRLLDLRRSEVFQFLGRRCDRVVSRVFVRLNLGRSLRPCQTTDEPETSCTDPKGIDPKTAPLAPRPSSRSR